MIPGETILSQKSLGILVDPHAGPFKVLQSLGSGLYYIGTMVLSCGECEGCIDYEKGAEIDYFSRETEYFKNQEEANTALEEYKTTGYLRKQRY